MCFANLIFSLILSNEKLSLYILFSCLFISCTNDLTTFSACDSPKFIDCCDGGELSVLTFNRSETTSFNSALRVVQETNPDIVGLQESFGFGLDIATSLGYCYYGNDESSVAFLSKYEMEFINDNYIKIYINDKNIINFFNVHFMKIVHISLIKLETVN